MLMSSAAFAAGDTEEAALAPGNAAAIQEAQGMDKDMTMEILAAAVVAIGIAVIVTTTTSTTSTTGAPG